MNKSKTRKLKIILTFTLGLILMLIALFTEVNGLIQFHLGNYNMSFILFVIGAISFLISLELWKKEKKC